jgi:beta-phosphoglucomutase family hydrolase
MPRHRGHPGIVLGLPDSIRACLFDLDGVLTDTAAVHRAAWKQVFDAVLAAHDQPPFTETDYNDYVDGKPRLDGVRDFLASRNLKVTEGSDDDPGNAETVHAIAERKNAEVQRRIKSDGVHVYPGSRLYLEQAQKAGLLRVVVSSSANTAQVLQVSDLERFIQRRVDGVTLDEEKLAGKPAPDSFLRGAELVGVSPAEAAVFEDATAGVEAGRRGSFGYVVGINRIDQAHARALDKHGADIVIDDLADLL